MQLPGLPGTPYVTSPGLEFAVILLLLPNYRRATTLNPIVAFLFWDKVTLEYLKPFEAGGACPLESTENNKMQNQNRGSAENK